MTTQRSLRPAPRPAPNRLGLPPPVALDLMHTDRHVGWVNGDAIGFRGFAGDVEATHAAWVAYRTLARRLAHRDGRRPIPIDTEPLTLVWRGDREVILASGRTVGTLVRPGPGRPGDPDTFGFEIRVPVPADEDAMRAKALLMYRTLRRAGIRWGMWSRGARQAPAALQPPGPPRTDARPAAPGSSPRTARRPDRAAEHGRPATGAGPHGARTRDTLSTAWSADAMHDALADSFPASDPPSWTPLRLGSPAARALNPGK